MLRHVVVFRWHPGTTSEQVAAVTAALRALPAEIGELAAYHVGADAGINEGNHAYAVVADFATAEDYLAYRDHPAHQAVIRDLIAPLVAERAAVQYEV